MRSILKYISFIIVLGFILYGLYLYPGKIVISSWFNYKIYSNVFALALVIIIIVVFVYILRILKSLLYLLFNKISLNDTLSKYINRIELSGYVDKEIQLNLINEIKNLKTLKLITYLNGLIQKKHYSKALSIIRKKENISKLNNILNYTRVEAMLASGLKKDAKDICKFYLNNNKNSTWAFLKLYDIVLREPYNDSIEDFEFLNKYLLHNKLKASEEVIEKVYCIINYKIAKKEYGINNDSMLKRVNLLIKKFPKFIPGYILLFKYLTSIGKRAEAIKLIIDSWQYNITCENTIFIDNVFSTEEKEYLVKEIKNLIKNNKNKDKVWILLAIIYGAYKDFINVNEAIINVKNTNDSLFKITKLYLFLKENDIKESKLFIQEFSKEIPLSWWSEYLK